MTDVDYYGVLGVATTASLREIRKAYKAHVRRVHPDKRGEAATFNAVQMAYEILSDPQQREIYDSERKTDGELDADDPLISFFKRKVTPAGPKDGMYTDNGGVLSMNAPDIGVCATSNKWGRVNVNQRAETEYRSSVGMSSNSLTFALSDLPI